MAPGLGAQGPRQELRGGVRARPPARLPLAAREIGTNWRMLEVQAASAGSSSASCRTWSERRRAHAETLDAGLEDLPGLRIERAPAHLVHAKYKHYVYVRPEALAAGWTRDRVMTEIVDRGVPCFSGSCSEVYLEEAFQRCGVGARRASPGGARARRDVADAAGPSRRCRGRAIEDGRGRSARSCSRATR